MNSAFDNHFTVLQKAFHSLKPGGWYEIHDATFELLCSDGSCTGSNIERWSQLMELGGAAVGRDFKVPKKYKQWLIDIGFVDVVEDVGPLPGQLRVESFSSPPPPTQVICSTSQRKRKIG